MLLRAFIGLVCGCLAGFVSFWCLVAVVPFLVFDLGHKSYRNALALIIAAAAGVLVCLFLPKGVEGEVESVGIVTRTSENYFLWTTLSGTYYVDSTLNPGLFSVLRLKGEGSPLLFYSFEGNFDFAGYLNRRNCYHSLTVESIQNILLVPDFLGGYRQWVTGYLASSEKALAESFLFAKGSGGVESYDALEKGGMTRFLSGTSMHLSFLIGLVTVKLKAHGKERFARFLAPCFTAFILVFSGFVFSARRLFVLAVLRAVKGKGKIIKDDIDAVSLAGIVLLFFGPGMVADGAFYFPFVLYFFFVCTRSFLKGFGKWKRALLSNLLAFMFVLPINLLETGSLNVLGGFLSVLMFYPSTVVYVLLLPLCLCPPYGAVAVWLIRGYLAILEFLSGLGVVHYGEIGWLFLLLWYGIFLVFLLFSLYLGKKKSLLTLLCLPFLLGLYPLKNLFPVKRVDFIYVGQGDCTLVRNGDTTVLIDTGGSTYEDIATDCLIPYFEKTGVKELDAVLLTHTDFDHSGALDSLLANFPVGEVIYGFETSGKFLAGGMEFYNLNPISNQDDNEGSAIFWFEVGSTSFLVMGDATVETEAKMLQAYPGIPCDVLRIGHHGSKTSTSDGLLEALNPSLAVISVGKNYYGHPTKEVLDRLAAHGIPYWRTDYDGTLKYSC